MLSPILSPTPTALERQIEEDFPGIWARLDRDSPATHRESFPIVTDGQTRSYPPGTQHPFGLAFSYIQASEPNPENRKVMQQKIAEGLPADTVIVSYSHDALQSVAAWRTTRLHYTFDADFFDALVATPLKGTPPAAIFQRLPAQAFFLSRKDGIDWGLGGKCLGIFVTVFADKLLLAPLTDSGKTNAKFVLRLNQDTVEDAIAAVAQEMLDSSIRLVRAHPKGTEQEKDEAIAQITKKWPVQEKSVYTTWGGVLSCLLYLCTEQPDIENKKIPAVKRIRMGNTVRVIAAKQDTDIQVGLRLGSVFRKNPEPSEDAADTRSNSAFSTMPAHVRRAHWHTYWVGKKSEQKPMLKWISAVLVNAQSSEQLVETLHPVQ